MGKTSYCFPGKFRLSKKKEIDGLFRKGQFAAVGYLKFKFIPQQAGYSRTVISVSKRVGNAVRRNRLKRLIREALRLSLFCDTYSLDCAIYITKPLRRQPTLAEVTHYLTCFSQSLPK